MIQNTAVDTTTMVRAYGQKGFLAELPLITRTRY